MREISLQSTAWRLRHCLGTDELGTMAPAVVIRVWRRAKPFAGILLLSTNTLEPLYEYLEEIRSGL